MNDVNILELTNNVADICIDLRKKYKIKLPDAIIAATALSMDLILITRNIYQILSKLKDCNY